MFGPGVEFKQSRTRHGAARFAHDSSHFTRRLPKRVEAQAPTETLDNFLLSKSELRPSQGVNRVLVLGLNNSARSRFMAWVMYHNADGIPDSTLDEWCPAVVQRAIESCKALDRRLGQMNHPLSAQIAALIPLLVESVTQTRPDVARRIYEIWKKVRDAQPPPYPDYFLDQIERILSPSYSATFADIVQVDFPIQDCWNSTMVFRGGGALFRLYEMDHRILRNPRMTSTMAKSITRVFYFVDLGDYDHILASLDYFERLWNLPLGHVYALIVFTHFQDFQSKIVTDPLQRVFPDYDGQTSAYNYILTKFRMGRPTSQTTSISIAGDLSEGEFTVLLSFVHNFVFSRDIPT
ncbi:hypothetical protein BDN72DRAFT_837895 [Pluteus cervinus]|uniref:Uncharacterized protein n=1 Tax=Pluteus cervinus TaxID=181527 RepID=A0ACD3AZV0_9AGAR|nr:hypothetical protein BDN72DRAFT_837895 [Pluteus cervinus]